MSVCVWLWCVSVPSLPALSCLTLVINELKAMVVIKRRSKKGSCLLPSYPQAEAAPIKDQESSEEDDSPTADAGRQDDSGPVEQGGPDDTLETANVAVALVTTCDSRRLTPTH